MKFIGTMAVVDNCDRCDSHGVCMSIMFDRVELTLCPPCFVQDAQVQEVTDGV